MSISSLEPYQGYTIDRAYKGQTFFWAYPPHTDDVMRFKFDQEITIEKYCNIFNFEKYTFHVQKQPFSLVSQHFIVLPLL